MSALRSASVRTLSPHRKALLTNVSSPDTPARQIPNSAISITALTHLSTSCRCEATESQTTYTMQIKNALRKASTGHKLGRGKGPRQQSVSKVLQQVHLSSWTRGNVGSIFNGLGAFAASAPSRLIDEVGRFVTRSDKKVAGNEENSASSQKHEKVHVIQPPVLEDTDSKHSEQYCTPVQDTDSETVREQHTLEQAFTDTNRGISSYHHSALSPRLNFPVRMKKSSKTEEDVGWNVFRSIPLPFMDTPTPVKKKPLIRKDFVSRSAVEARTRALVASVKSASAHSSKLTRIQDLCKHLKQYPSGRHEATECKVIPTLLNMAQSETEELQQEAREALALLGYTNPVQGRGIRILALDGGGTRGLLTIQCLKKIERLSDRRIFELFDYVCGVSTGALIAAMVCLYRLPLEKCEQLYLEFSRKMFSRSRVVGTGGLVWNHAFYNSDQWEEILRAEIGHKTMIEFARDPLTPKMSAISTLMNTPRMKNFVFRNYNLPPSTYSQYPGSCIHELWQVIRASSAAPGYYEDFPLGDYVHADGGLAINNPTALAVHESRLLWPNENIQCVVSLGTGRYEPTMELTGNYSKVSLKEKVSKIVDSATDTEAVHVMMTDLMPPATYFRFNPYLSDDLQLDEIRQDRLDSMLRDATMYLRKNDRKMQKAIDTLKQSRMPHQHAMDWLKLKTDALR